MFRFARTIVRGAVSALVVSALAGMGALADANTRTDTEWTAARLDRRHQVVAIEPHVSRGLQGID